ncbi:MAG: hypothetical protein ACQKBT_04840 [Puniceicoccales bacterium]
MTFTKRFNLFSAAVGTLLLAQFYAGGRTIEVDFSKLPDQSLPTWTRVGAGDREISNDILILDSGTEESAGYIIRGDKLDYIWNGEWPVTLTFEARASRIDDSPLPAAHLICRGDGWRIQIPIIEEEWLRYEVTIDTEGNATLQIDEKKPQPLRMIHDSSSARTIAFGDLGRFASGASEWRKLQWTDSL